MAVARKAVDSTLRRLLRYTGEITLSIILLVIVCLPLVFVVPMWIQQIGLGADPSQLAVNPVAWFGSAGAVIVTTILAIVSGLIGYGIVSKMPSGAKVTKDAVETLTEGEPEAAPVEEPVEEAVDEDLALIDASDDSEPVPEDDSIIADASDDET